MEKIKKSKNKSKAPFDDFDFCHKQLNEKGLNKICDKLGVNSKRSMGRDLMKFFLSMVPPDRFTWSDSGSLSSSSSSSTPPSTSDEALDDSFPLPIFMYHSTNYFFQYFMNTLKNDNEAEEWNISSGLFKIAPQWYLDKIEELNDYRLVNNYVVWVLNTYEKFINEEVKYGVDSSGNALMAKNETRRAWMEKTIPWVRKEREKTFYMMQSIQNKLMSIIINGVKSVEDLTYLYFYDAILVQQLPTMPEYAQNLFLMADSLIEGKNFTADSGRDSMLVRGAKHFGLNKTIIFTNKKQNSKEVNIPSISAFI